MLSCCPKSHDHDCFGWVEFEAVAKTMPLDQMIEEHRAALDCCDNFSVPTWREHFPAMADADLMEKSAAEKSAE